MGATAELPAPQSAEGLVLLGQLRLLESTTPGAIGNAAAALVVVLVARAELPVPAAIAWVAAMVAAILGLLLRSRVGRRDDPVQDLQTTRRLRHYVLFAVAIGGCWGVPSLLLGNSLSAGHMMFLAVVVAGATAACCAALGAYLPAFLGFCLAALLPLALALFRRPEADATWMAPLMLVYAATLAGVVLSYNRSTVGTLRLRVANEELARNLTASQAAAAAATQSKWDTLAHLSHELRTPMTAIIGFSEAMHQEMFGALSPRYRAYSEDIHTSGRYALDLIDAILEASRAEAGQIALTEEAIGTRAFVEECVRMVEAEATERGITLTCQVEALPDIVADRAKLRQVVFNLLANAIKYTPAGGSAAVVARPGDGGLEIAISDTGIGIAAADLARCFEPFVRLSSPMTNKVPGAGLGLPIAQRLTEAHGGALDITSTLGRGTVMTVRLPASRWVERPA